jgi:hypothetical protein
MVGRRGGGGRATVCSAAPTDLLSAGTSSFGSAALGSAGFGSACCDAGAGSARDAGAGSAARDAGAGSARDAGAGSARDAGAGSARDAASRVASVARLLSGLSGIAARIVPGKVPERFGGGGGGLRLSVTSSGGAEVSTSASSGPVKSLRLCTVRGGGSLGGRSSDQGSRIGARGRFFATTRSMRAARSASAWLGAWVTTAGAAWPPERNNDSLTVGLRDDSRASSASAPNLETAAGSVWACGREASARDASWLSGGLLGLRVDGKVCIGLEGGVSPLDELSRSTGGINRRSFVSSSMNSGSSSIVGCGCRRASDRIAISRAGSSGEASALGEGISQWSRSAAFFFRASARA